MFDRVIIIDWSGGNDTGPRPRRDALWACAATREDTGTPIYFRNRALIESWMTDQVDAALTRGERLCLGFDFPFGYPRGLAAHLTGQADPLALWDWFATRIEDSPGANNRFDLAGEINRGLGSAGPFWANALKRDIAGLPRTKAGYRNPFPDRRRVEQHAKGSFTCWQMAGAGSVGGQVMMGLPVLARLRRRFAGRIGAWPFDAPDAPVQLLEVWPSLDIGPPPPDRIKDAWQVETVARRLARLPAETLAYHLSVRAPEEGWIFGVDPAHAQVAA